MRVTASRLRENIYKLLDQVLETGEPLEIERKDGLLRIERVHPEAKGSRLDRLVPHPGFIKGDPMDLVHIDWSVYWNPDPDLT